MPVKAKSSSKKLAVEAKKTLKKKNIHRLLPTVLINVASKLVARAKESRITSVHKTGKLSRKTEMPQLSIVPGWWRFMGRATKLIIKEWKNFLPLFLIFVTLAWLVNGVYSLDSITGLKLAAASLGDTLNTFEQSVLGTIGLFGETLTSFQGSASDGATQMLMGIIFILAWLSILWIARYGVAKQKTSLRDAIYRSGAGFLPTFFIIIIILFQLLPAAAALVIFSVIAGDTGIVTELYEVALFAVLGVLLLVMSVYFLTSSLIALQVVSLPGMYPFRALTSAKRIISGRRFLVFRKLLAILFSSAALWIMLILPVIFLDNAICGNEDICFSTSWVVPFALFAVSIILLSIIAISIYLLYRSLLEKNEKGI